jgi:cytochrome c oxidase assembly protein subunit 15
MLLYPLDTWLGGPWQVFIEHGHRLLGALAGLITIALCLALWLCDERRWVRWLGVAALAGVIGQGLLGGFRVIENQRLLAMVHGCVGPAFFGLAVSLAVVTSRWWRRSEATDKGMPEADKHARSGSRLARLAIAVTGLAYLQILLGAQVRHVPATASPGWFQAVIVFHVVVGLALAAHALWIAAVAVWRHRREKPLLRPAVLLAVCVTVQLALGGGAWVLNYGWPEWFQGTESAESHLTVARSSGQNLTTTAHVAVGSLIFALAVALALRACRSAAVLKDRSMTATRGEKAPAPRRSNSSVRSARFIGLPKKKLLVEMR